LKFGQGKNPITESLLEDVFGIEGLKKLQSLDAESLMHFLKTKSPEANQLGPGNQQALGESISSPSSLGSRKKSKKVLLTPNTNNEEHCVEPIKKNTILGLQILVHPQLMHHLLVV